MYRSTGSLFICAFALVLALLGGCDERRPPGGFFVRTVDVLFVFPLPPVTLPHGGPEVHGSWNRDLGPTASGDMLNFGVITPTPEGIIFIPNGDRKSVV